VALVKCRECSSEISEAAATCPRCGVSAPGGTASLTFTRSGFVNSGIRIEVFIDQQPFGTLRGKTPVVVPVTPGRHHIELRTSQRKSTVGTVEVSHGEKVFNVTMSTMGRPRFQ
jgi:hypothetical protein